VNYLAVTTEEIPSREPRLRRDTYLGAAAVALAAGSLLSISGLLDAAGFVLFGVAFLAAAGRRTRRLRWGAFVLAASSVVTLVWASVAMAASGLHTVSSSAAIQSAAFSLPSIGASLLVASAFASGRDGRARNRRLGWAAATAGAAGALALLYGLIADWGTFGASDPTERVTRAALLAGHLFYAVAGATAATGFFRAARAPESFGSDRLAKREAYLAIAAAWLLLSYICRFAEWVRFFHVMGAGLGSLDPVLLLLILSGVGSVVASVLAVIGFALSRRSLLKRGGPTCQPVEAAED
jgi:hypothetical protein